MSFIRKRGVLAASITALALSVSLVGCAGSDSADGGEEATETVRIGVVPGGQPYWDAYVDAAAEEGIDVEIVDFSEYPVPNPLVSDGDLELNQFQHIAYLAAHNVDADDDLVAIGSTATYPMNVFSDKHDSIEDIPEGGTVAVPNDVSNGARALLLLQKLGLVELKDGGNSSSTAADVIADKSKVSVQALNAELIPAGLPDVDAGVVNNDYVEPNGLKWEDSLAADSAEDEAAQPYINIFAARAEDKDNPTYLKLVDIFQNDENVQAAFQDYIGDSAVPVSVPQDELADILAQAEEDYRDQK
ncbi:MetQ/NlpA family ABC transporter substrate-binding protein [Leucobacter sp. GX24907]